ncbi:PEP/pyruvate-binding domain-containing protein [Anaeromyxobacter diazotrophicus]|uniref:Phosphoenolpyruvate synthase n=1 Tax=Anaeromyxobacter diazotrophicus TaxID=2590199 RepID=A0A7I9VNU1_9BACT|nr:PEP/pyruvate-binding domain-containing protein [Anaeromyxobacter diazotrophicus]GEJ58085.1 phosphoenolpyruvate synthase [Anaeromyxobacter diazotrophicus]
MTSPSGADPAAPSTGLPALDGVLGGLRAGDNVVFQVESTDDYALLARPFVARALAQGRRLVYFRFARHAPLVEEGAGVRVERLSPAIGFESFTAAIHRAIAEAGPGAFHVFDCLSDLAADWYSDLMLGNFFMVTCPYLYELATVTCFGLLRDQHATQAIDAIRNTTQVLVDVFRRRRGLYVQPLRVEGRHTPTLYLPHAWEGDDLRALTESAELADVADRPPAGLGRLDVWDRRFREARELREACRAGARPWKDEQLAFQALLRMVLTRDDRFAELAGRSLELGDLLAVQRRMIGTGLVGGKAAGMLVARAILARAHPRWSTRLEPHDSWFIGSDVFYSYLVRNGCWRARRELRGGGPFLEVAAAARARVLAGTFPDFVVQQLVAMLEHYGQSPIIVRSSSLLEDGFGNAFTGKYESVFCPNQGSPAERLEAVLSAIRTVYASSMSEEALRYRERRGLLDRDEQMAVLVQRVSGGLHGAMFYPQLAGVALSYNPYVWDERIDPQAGVVRLVFGLGTRAVERADDDYTRIVALNAPSLRPETSLDEVTEYAQRRVDVLDLEARRLTSLGVDEVIRYSPGLPVRLLATARQRGGGWVLTFEELLWGTPFPEEMREILAALRDAYGTPVDVEFTGNFGRDGQLRLNVVQCRPLQVREGGGAAPMPRQLAPGALLLQSRGPVVGQSTHTPVDRVVFVDPEAYAALATQERHEVGRVVGRATRLAPAGELRLLLVGPGRWGTTTPSLGVPVSLAEIQRASAVCEVMQLGQVIPDVSLGSHFFNDLVEENILYLAVYPTYVGHAFERERLLAAPNRLPELLPDDARLAEVVRVIDFPLPGDARTLWLDASCVRQEASCYLLSPE